MPFPSASADRAAFRIHVWGRSGDQRTLSLNLFAVRIMHQNCILDIEEKELDLKKLQERPGIVCYVVQPEDTLWDIAKKYYTTSEHIRNMNHLTEEIRAGQKLLIVKSAVLHTAS